LGAAAEFERSLILERTRAGQLRYKHDFESGRVGKTVNSRSGRNMPPHRPKKIFNREQVIELRRQGLSIRQVAHRLGLGLGRLSARYGGRAGSGHHSGQIIGIGASFKDADRLSVCNAESNFHGRRLHVNLNS
jgi:DNA invertase Pin-like site-specific DNA recombinase